MGYVQIDVLLKQDNKLHRMDLEEAVLHELAGLDIISGDYSPEVLKVISILKRSQLVKEVKNSKYAASSIKHIAIDMEVIDKLSSEKIQMLKDAVDSTKKIIVVNGNKAVDLFITGCCGGGTSNSEDVLGYRINYLRRVLCKYCMQNCSERVVSISDYAKKLNLKGLIFKESMDGIFNDVERDETGRIISISFLGLKMTGEEFANFFGIDSNRAYFLEDSVIFKAIGKGMGLGICLEGANNMAKEGAGYEEIIRYYYTGIDFEYLDEYTLLKTLNNKKIVIDPGHGGRDIGNVCGNITEKEANLRIALLLGKRLLDIGANVLLTRQEDVDVALSDRANHINNERPELYISIHQNYFMSPGVNGVEGYCYHKDEEAMRLGKLICDEVSRGAEVKNRGMRMGDYFLLRECKISGVIIECMYMTGQQDKHKYNEEYFNKIADAMFKSICAYYNIEP